MSASGHSKKKIALVNQPFDAVIPPRLNSLGLWTWEVARRLAKEHEVHVFAGQAGWQGREAREGDVHYHFLATPSRGLGKEWPGPSARRPFFASSLFYGDFAWQLGRALARERFDVVHVLNFSQFVPVARRACPQARVALHMECSWVDELDAGWIGHRLDAADVLIGCSDFITDAARARFPEARCRFQTVYNGVDPDRFGIRDWDAEPGPERRLLYVGRGSPEKGTHVLVDAFGRLRRDDPAWQLDLIGGVGAAPARYVVAITNDPLVREMAPLFGPGYKDTIRAAIDEAGEGAIRIEQPQAHETLVRRYQQADAFTFPSVWEEPFGIPLIEAMSVGLPVVGTRGGAMPEIVEDGVTGILVPRGDAEALHRAFARLAGDAGLRRRMGEAGRKRVLARFGWDRIVSDLLAAYALA